MKAEPKLFKKSGAWKAEPLYSRLHNCKTMLSIWGMLTAAESALVHKRILKAVAKDAREAGESP